VSGVLPPDRYKKGANTVESIHSALNTTRKIMTNIAQVIKFPGDPERVLINNGVEKTTKKFGWVYVLSNDAMPGLVKIGFTAKCPYIRARDISRGTGVPLPFDVIYAAKTLYFAEVEARTHYLLSEHRINSLREFFYQTPEEAFTVITTLVKQVKNECCSDKLRTIIYNTAIKSYHSEHGDYIEDEPFFSMEQANGQN